MKLDPRFQYTVAESELSFLALVYKYKNILFMPRQQNRTEYLNVVKTKIQNNFVE